MINVPFKVGDVQTFTKTFTKEDIQTYADLTGDHALIHEDSEYAKNSVYGSMIAHGLLTFSLAASASTLAHEPYDEQISCVTYGYDHLRFTAPVLVNDTVTCYYTVDEVDYEKGRSYADVVMKNQHDKVVLVARHIMQWIPFEE